jgi:hypothetical protein
MDKNSKKIIKTQNQNDSQLINNEKRKSESISAMESVNRKIKKNLNDQKCI